MNDVFLNIQRREKLLLVKDPRSFIEKGIRFAGSGRLARISLVEIGVEEGISTQTTENVSKVPKGETKECLQNGNYWTH